MKNVKNIIVNSLTVLVMILSSCNQKNNERIHTPYGVAFKAEDLNSVTDKEIEYFIIGEDFIYMFKKSEDIATYIIPTKNVKFIAPLKKNAQKSN